MWPADALTFLEELEANNDRDWFRANRARYDAHLVEPARALAARLGDLGPPRFFRPYNDTRFHARPPIKEQLGVVLGQLGLGAYYFELSLDGLVVGAGMHHPARDQLERFRRAMDDERRVAAFQRAVRSAARTGMALAEPGLKRAPRGWPADHPRLAVLRLTRLTVGRREELGPWVHTEECAERVGERLRAARPLVRWLGQTVGPAGAP